MRIYDEQTKLLIKELRRKGHTYPEIQKKMGYPIPKGTLSYICKDVTISSKGRLRLQRLAALNTAKARKAAVYVNRRLFEQKLAKYRLDNAHLADLMRSRDTQLIALAMLYLGEGAKWQGSRSPRLGSTSPEIIRLYVNLLRLCYNVSLSSLWCRVQCRADQDQKELVAYWSSIVGIKANQFYPCYVDKRTIGRPTKQSNYKGVCVVGSAGTHIQLELAEISSIIDEALGGISAVG